MLPVRISAGGAGSTGVPTATKPLNRNLRERAVIIEAKQITRKPRGTVLTDINLYHQVGHGSDAGIAAGSMDAGLRRSVLGTYSLIRRF